MKLTDDELAVQISRCYEKLQDLIARGQRNDFEIATLLSEMWGLLGHDDEAFLETFRVLGVNSRRRDMFLRMARAIKVVPTRRTWIALGWKSIGRLITYAPNKSVARRIEKKIMQSVNVKGIVPNSLETVDRHLKESGHERPITTRAVFGDRIQRLEQLATDVRRLVDGDYGFIVHELSMDAQKAIGLKPKSKVAN